MTTDQLYAIECLLEKQAAWAQSVCDTLEVMSTFLKDMNARIIRLEKQNADADHSRFSVN